MHNTPPDQLLTPPPAMAAMGGCRGCGCTEGEACPIRVSKTVVIPCWWAAGYDQVCSACVFKLHPLKLAQLAFGDEAMLRIRALADDIQAGRVQPLLEPMHQPMPHGGSPR